MSSQHTLDRPAALTPEMLTPGTLTPDAVRAVVRRFYDPFRSGDLAAFDAVLAPGWRNDPADPRGGDDARAAMRANVAAIRAALPDLAHVQEAVVVEPTPDGGALAAVRSRLAGTHRGAFLGVAPTGRPVAIRTMDMHRVGPDGRIVETWHLEDFFGLFRQLGAAPAGPPAAPPTAPELVARA